jgi:hypothetical protein
MHFTKKYSPWVLIFSLISTFGYGQFNNKLGFDGRQNVIESTVPFLTIAPDSRAGAMGDAGVATSPDINSQHWNPAKFAFIDGKGGIALSYTPWLRNIVTDINLAYLTGYYRVDRQQVISGSLRYFSLGNITFTDDQGNEILPFNPNEFALDAGYSRIFSDKMSGGMAFRFIRSDLSGRMITSGGETKPGIAFAADISTYYHKPIKLQDKDAELSFGLNISNIGTKISYTDGQEKSFIPINLKLGSALNIDIDDYNSIGFALDLNKLLVPTSPIYYAVDDTLPDGTVYQSGEKPVIKYGFDPDVSSAVGMIRSFYDAPGGIREELNEIMISAGTEYWYRNQFALRGGYFYEHATKGNRKYFSLGVGLKLNVFALDFAYLVPTSGRTNPLANTIRFSLSFNFDKNSSKKKN